jgi:conserved domain protein
LLQKAGLQGEIKVACGVEALGRLFGLKRYQSVVYGFSIIAGQTGISACQYAGW